MDIKKETKEIIETVTNRFVECEGEVLLSSIEILMIVSELERKFEIAIDDRKIFRQVFTTYENLFQYLEKKIYDKEA